MKTKLRERRLLIRLRLFKEECQLSIPTAVCKSFSDSRNSAKS